MQNSGKWFDFPVKNNIKTLLFATREYLILFSVEGNRESGVTSNYSILTAETGGTRRLAHY